jgi:hypothetical protein
MFRTFLRVYFSADGNNSGGNNDNDADDKANLEAEEKAKKEAEEKTAEEAKKTAFEKAEEAAKLKTQKEAEHRKEVEEAAKALNYLQNDFKADYESLDETSRAVIDHIMKGNFSGDVEKANTLKDMVGLAYLKLSLPQIEYTTSLKARIDEALRTEKGCHEVAIEVKEVAEQFAKNQAKTHLNSLLKGEDELKSMSEADRIKYNSNTGQVLLREKRRHELKEQTKR